MTTYAEITAEDELVIERLLPGPIERVWDYLTDGDKRRDWLAGGRTDPSPGGAIVFEFDHSRLSDSPPPEKYADQQVVTMTGEVLVYEPPHRLAFTWPEKDAPDARVTITLAAEGGKVRLRLVHSGLGGPDYRIGVSAGWHGHLDMLGNALAGDPRGDFWVRHMALEKTYKERLGL
ncbi:MAG: SRPBCC family protein [Pseudomonadota bacterium]